MRVSVTGITPFAPRLRYRLAAVHKRLDVMLSSVKAVSEEGVRLPSLWACYLCQAAHIATEWRKLEKLLDTRGSLARLGSPRNRHLFSRLSRQLRCILGLARKAVAADRPTHDAATRALSFGRCPKCDEPPFKGGGGHSSAIRSPKCRRDRRSTR